jgi:hypothetical protein
MLARLKPMREIFMDPAVIEVPKNNHYWKFYYKDKQALGFRDFYLKYWKGNRLVDIKPKRDRKKNIIPGKFEVYGKRGNYVFTAYEFWFDYIKIPSECPAPKVPRCARIKARQNALGNLPWDDLFDI